MPEARVLGGAGFEPLPIDFILLRQYTLRMTGTGQFLEGKLSTTITPQLIESAKLAAMPAIELRERILREAEENPALEIAYDPAASREPPARGESPLRQKSEVYPSAGGGIAGKEKSDAHRDFFEKVLSRRETLQEHLAAGLSEIKLAPETEALARGIISSLDSSGFLAVPPETLPGGGNAKALADALSVVQGIDPPGCAARDALDSLAIQAALRAEEADGSEEKRLFSILASLLQGEIRLEGKSRPESLKVAIKREAAQDAARLEELLRELEPFPGRNFPAGEDAGQEASQYIVPDIIVVKKDGSFHAKMNDDEIPVVRVSKPFEQFAGKSPRGQHKKEEKAFVRDSVKSARWFIDALKRRRKTLFKVAAAVIARQRPFFERGPKFIQPLRMLDVAEDLDLHEATVSRAVSGKYLQCEWGLFSLRHFFSANTGASSADGTGKSKESVKEIMREMLSSPSKRPSDREIAEKLSELGIKIARRTVAKYRAELQK